MGFLVQRRLEQVGKRLRALREELRIIDEQQAQMVDEADDWELRSIVGDGGGPAAGEAKLARRHADAQLRRRAAVVDEIGRHERRQDELLDEFTKR